MSLKKCVSVLLLAFLFGTLIGTLTSLIPEIKATDVSGEYYFWGVSPTHGQPTGNGHDIGLLNKTRPTAWSRRQCGQFVQFFLDENGTYGENTFTSLYIHFCWSSTQLPDGIRFGYDVNGSYGTTDISEQSWNITDYVEFFYTNGSWTDRTYSDYKITVAYYDITDWTLSGTDVYNFNLDFNGMALEGVHPEVASPPNNPSFIIINPPSLTTLTTQDSDGDGLSDYDEMFVYYTDPQVVDTFGTGWTDNGEPTGSYAAAYPWRTQQEFFNDSKRMHTLTSQGTESTLNYIRLNKFWNVISANMTVSAFPNSFAAKEIAYAAQGYAFAVGDVNNDGENELVVGYKNTMSGTYLIKVYNTSDWSVLFTSSEYASQCYALVIGDLNSTYAGNELAISYSDGNVTVLNSTFNQIWSLDVGTFPCGLAIADVDADGEPELVIGERNDFKVYNSSFELEHTESISGSSGSLAVGDVNNDGTTELVVGYANSASYVKVYDSDYTMLEEWTTSMGKSHNKLGIKLEDIDNDGNNEIVVCGYYGIEAYRLEGSVLTKLWAVDSTDAFTHAEYMLTVADLDGDSKYEIVATSGNHAIWIYDYQGNLLRQWNNAGISVSAWGDVDNDGDNDLVISEETFFLVYDDFPNSLSVDVGIDGSNEFSANGLFCNETFDITTAVNNYLNSSQNEWVNVPVNITFTNGTLGVSCRVICEKGLESPFFDTRLYAGAVVAATGGAALAWWYRRKKKQRTVSVP